MPPAAPTATVNAPPEKAAPYVLPFLLFLGFLAVQSWLEPLGSWQPYARLLVVSAAVWIYSRQVIDWRISSPLGSVLMGSAVFAIWIAPDVLIPGYRNSILFQNSLTGRLPTGPPPAVVYDPVFLIGRVLVATLLVPVIEELFWRGFLMRWLIDQNFGAVSLGAYRASAFWIASALFASEHGAFWDVGLLAGVAYNAWIIRTQRLGDCILAHAVTNGLLCAYVIGWGQYQYWL